MTTHLKSRYRSLFSRKQLRKRWRQHIKAHRQQFAATVRRLEAQ